jgi:hypothetical protein
LLGSNLVAARGGPAWRKPSRSSVNEVAFYQTPLSARLAATADPDRTDEGNIMSNVVVDLE